MKNPYISQVKISKGSLQQNISSPILSMQGCSTHITQWWLLIVIAKIYEAGEVNYTFSMSILFNFD